jgi:glycosyltransferase involved in cell wall biosynthesis
MPLEATDYPVEFSVIITCYFEESSIEEFYSRLSGALNRSGRSYEIVFVNDGSTDNTFEKLRMIFENDPHVTTVADLFRNAGQAAAMTAGITFARGKHFIFMDSDLQLDPEELELLMSRFDAGYDIVSGCRKDRKDPLFRRAASQCANWVMRKVAGHPITDFGCTFKIYHGNLIRAFHFGPLKQFQTVYVYSRAQRCVEVPITHHPRKYGKSGWTLKKLSMFYFDNLIGISKRPFQLMALLCIAGALLFLVRILVAWAVDFSILPKVTPGMILNILIFHLLLMLSTLSVIGEYVIRTFLSIQKYPLYVVRELHQQGRA